MELINPSVERIDLQGMQLGEFAARLCYESTSKDEVSSEAFINKLLILGHGSPLEFITIFLRYERPNGTVVPDFIKNFENNAYSRVTVVPNEVKKADHLYCDAYYITTNLRVIMQGSYEHWEDAVANQYDKNWKNVLTWKCQPTSLHAKRYTFLFTLSERIAREFNRHRCHSICQRSTRFVDFSKRGIQFIKPLWYDKYAHSPNSYEYRVAARFMEDCAISERDYQYLREDGILPQDAADVLSMATATKCLHCAYLEDWKDFVILRTSKKAHPMAQLLAKEVAKELSFTDYC